MKTNCHLSNQGFSLFELLMTLAIIGTLAGLAIPMFSDSRDRVEQARNRRNAQEIVSTCAAAQVAGLDFVVPGDEIKTIQNVITGGTPTDGAFEGRLFRVPNIHPSEISEIARYTELAGDTLVYIHSGSARGGSADISPAATASSSGESGAASGPKRFRGVARAR